MESTVQPLHIELINRCREGDRDAFHQVYKLYSKAMFNVSYRVLGRHDEAEDALQEAFISAFKNLASYRGDAAFGAWLKKIVVNKAITALHKRRMESLPDHEDWDVPEPDVEPLYGEGLSVDQVKKAIMGLPDGYRTVLSLYLLEGYDHQEIAEIMNISESTSKSQLNRAKGKLRELLSHVEY